MTFTVESILLSLFTALVAGLGSYFGYYVKARAELRAATEDLKQHIVNQAEVTRAVEREKLKIATEGAVGSEARKCIYSLVSAIQSHLHSMCWLAWDATQRNTVRDELAKLYDLDAHRLQPEILAQQALLSRLDNLLYQRTQKCIEKLFDLDVRFGKTIVLSETMMPPAVTALRELLSQSYDLKSEVDSAFNGGN